MTNGKRILMADDDFRACYVPKGSGIWPRLKPFVIKLLGLDRQPKGEHPMETEADRIEDRYIDAMFPGLSTKEASRDESCGG